ncbi:MAG: hypothetical protein A2X59_01905 [Nitrospirae bacterium GWC2_42_7]|nr:MAG: hypothetical protein A2X59_01905 [Nitrospirae bacterium GWC2_42_7]
MRITNYYSDNTFYPILRATPPLSAPPLKIRGGRGSYDSEKGEPACPVGRGELFNYCNKI